MALATTRRRADGNGQNFEDLVPRLARLAAGLDAALTACER